MRLDRLLNAAIQQVLGSVESGRVLSEDRTGLMNQIRDLAKAQASDLGIDVIDVRLTVGRWTYLDSWRWSHVKRAAAATVA